MSSEERLKVVSGQAELLLFQRKYQEVLQLAQNVPDESLAAIPGASAGKYYVVGISQKHLGDEAAARTAFLKAKTVFEEELKQKADDPGLHIQLAKVLAWLGEKDAAIAEAQRAIDLRPESKDAFDGPKVTEDVAQVYAILGDNARAIRLLDGLLSRTTGVTLQSLKANPAWDLIRNDPAFQALFTKYAGKA
jgi:tetratricopeptide (TPR) repeat protein